MIYGYNIPTKHGFAAIFKRDDKYILDIVNNIVLDLSNELKVFYNSKNNGLFKDDEIIYSVESTEKVEDIFNKLIKNDIVESDISLESYGMFASFMLK